VGNGLQAVNAAAQFVLVHDAARPCVPDEDIDAAIAAARQHGAAILATPVDAALKTVDKGIITGTLAREGKWLAQTPQVFRHDWLVQSFARRGDHSAYDEAELVERAGHHVHVVTGSPLNIKITTKRDLKLATAILKSMPAPRLDVPSHPFADDNLWR
jgi:2-C-methyl-D-erythritol 4-phosphate cytidylyltransferase